MICLARKSISHCSTSERNESKYNNAFVSQQLKNPQNSSGAPIRGSSEFFCCYLRTKQNKILSPHHFKNVEIINKPKNPSPNPPSKPKQFLRRGKLDTDTLLWRSNCLSSCLRRIQSLKTAVTLLRNQQANTLKNSSRGSRRPIGFSSSLVELSRPPCVETVLWIWAHLIGKDFLKQKPFLTVRLTNCVSLLFPKTCANSPTISTWLFMYATKSEQTHPHVVFILQSAITLAVVPKSWVLDRFHTGYIQSLKIFSSE